MIQILLIMVFLQILISIQILQSWKNKEWIIQLWRNSSFFTFWRSFLLLEIDEDGGSFTGVGLVVLVDFERSSIVDLFIVCKVLVVPFDWVIVVGVDVNPKFENESPFVDDARYKKTKVKRILRLIDQSQVIV